MLITRTGLGLTATPGTVSPASHSIASIASASLPFNVPKLRAINSFDDDAPPATPTPTMLPPKPVCAAIVPATCKP